MATPGKDGMPDVPWAQLPEQPQASGDARSILLDATGRAAIDQRLKDLFHANRQRMALTHPMFGVDRREQALRELDSAAARALPKRRKKPVPGGAGYGVLYLDALKNGFSEGTALYWEIVFPPEKPGGSVSTYLYLTATNRAALGVEALIAYNGQSAPNFFVYDWARPLPDKNRWWGPVPLEKLAPYVRQAAAHGAEYTTLPLVNMTIQTGPNSWANQVWLLRVATNQWEPLYQFPYGATPDSQHGSWVGSWGPTLEGFEPTYHNTLPMGALNTNLRGALGGQWGPWSVLQPADSQIRKDSMGFLQVFVDPNWSWVVVS